MLDGRREREAFRACLKDTGNVTSFNRFLNQLSIFEKLEKCSDSLGLGPEEQPAGIPNFKHKYMNGWTYSEKASTPFVYQALLFASLT